MDKYNLTKYATEKYGVDESIAETFANMFSILYIGAYSPN
jgi:hypothetical protein